MVPQKRHSDISALLCWRSLTGSPLLLLQRLLTSQNARGFLGPTCGSQAVKLQLVTSPKTVLRGLLGCPNIAWPDSGLLLCSRFLLLVVGSTSCFLGLHAASASEPLSFTLLLCSCLISDCILHYWLPGHTMPLPNSWDSSFSDGRLGRWKDLFL